MAEGIHHALRMQDVIGEDQILNIRSEIAARLRR
jgi:hypothetical protein